MPTKRDTRGINNEAACQLRKEVNADRKCQSGAALQTAEFALYDGTAALQMIGEQIK